MGTLRTSPGSCDTVNAVWCTWGNTMPHCCRVNRHNQFCGHFVQKTAISCIAGIFTLACVVPSPCNSLWTSPVPIRREVFRIRSIQYPHRPHERFSRRRGRKTVIFSRFLRDCGRLEYAIINRRKPLVHTRMVHLESNFEGQTPNESTTGLPEDNEMDPLSRYGGG